MRGIVKFSCILVLLASSVRALELDENITAQREELLFREVPVVVAAARHEQKITEASSLVTVITAEDIKNFGYRTLAEVLRAVTGFYTSYDREYVHLGVRGFNRPGDWGNRILLMVNGHYYNENIYGGAYTGNTFGIDLDLVKRIEIVRGPGSALYGTNALFAVINVITKTGEELEGIRANVGYGTFNEKKGNVIIGMESKDNLNILLSGSVLDSDGNRRLYFPEFDAPPTSDGWAQDLDWEKGYRLFANINYGRFSIFANANSREKAFPTASYNTIFNDPRAEEIDKRGFFEVKFQPKIADDKSGLLRFYYDNYIYTGNFPFDYPPPTLNQDYSEGNWWGSELQLSWDLNPSNRLIVGAEYQDHIKVLLENYDADPYNLILRENRPISIFSTYLQDEMTLGKINLTLGARNDNYPEYGSVFNPRLGLVFPAGEDRFFKLLYGQAFRAPNSYEKYYGDGISSKPNPSLKPETINTYEMVFEQGLPLTSYFALALYKYNISNLITQITDPSDGLLQYQNVDTISAAGAEITLRKSLGANGTYGYLGYAYQKTINDATGQVLENSPENSGSAGLVYVLPDRKTSIGTELIYLDRRLTLAGNYAPSYLLTNLTLNTETLFDSEITFKVNNLFDTQYADPGSGGNRMDTISQDGRTWQIKVSKKF